MDFYSSFASLLTRSNSTEYGGGIHKAASKRSNERFILPIMQKLFNRAGQSR